MSSKRRLKFESLEPRQLLSISYGSLLQSTVAGSPVASAGVVSTGTSTAGHTAATATSLTIVPDPEYHGSGTSAIIASNATNAVAIQPGSATLAAQVATAVANKQLIVTQQTGTITSASDVDYYSFVAPVTGQMTIVMAANNSSNVQPHLYVYNVNNPGPNQTLVLNQQNANASSLSSIRITVNVTAGSTYYVETAAKSGIGAYILQFSTVPATPDSPGTFSSASTIVINLDGALLTPVHGAIDFLGIPSSNLAGDSDVYSFASPLSGAIEFREVAMTGGLSPQLSAYLGNDSPITIDPVNVSPLPTSTYMTVTSTGDITLNNLVAGSTYYVEAAAVNGLTAGSYALSSTLAPSPPITTLIQQYEATGSITRPEMIAILDQAVGLTSFNVTGVGGHSLSATDFSSLKAMLQPSTKYTIPGYVKVLANDVINGNVANAQYTGGVSTTVSLGNLRTGSTAKQMEELVGKWFLGTDLPDPAVDNTLPNGQTSVTNLNYEAITGQLYSSNEGNAPSYLDMEQGELGDCYFISTMGSIAKTNPKAIENMIIPNYNLNGTLDGTYTVRFYNSATPDYVTVNNMLAIDPSYFNLIAYDGAWTITNASSSTNILWLPLIEKAYAQWNEVGNEGHNAANGSTGYDGVNAYAPIAGGFMQPVYDQVLGTATDQSISYPSNQAATDLTSVPQSVLQSALASGLAATIATQGEGIDTDYDTDGLFLSHAYMVVGYDSVANKFLLRNPWGDAPNSPAPEPVTQPPELTWAQLQTDCDLLSIANPKTSVVISSSPTAPAKGIPTGAAVPGSSHAGAAGAWLASVASNNSQSNSTTTQNTRAIDLALLDYAG